MADTAAIVRIIRATTAIAISLLRLLLLLPLPPRAQPPPHRKRHQPPISNTIASITGIGVRTAETSAAIVHASKGVLLTIAVRIAKTTTGRAATTIAKGDAMIAVLRS